MFIYITAEPSGVPSILAGRELLQSVVSVGGNKMFPSECRWQKQVNDVVCPIISNNKGNTNMFHQQQPDQLEI